MQQKAPLRQRPRRGACRTPASPGHSHEAARRGSRACAATMHVVQLLPYARLAYFSLKLVFRNSQPLQNEILAHIVN